MKSRPRFSGGALGVLLLDDPGMYWPLGSMANAETFNTPVQFGVVPGLTPQRVIAARDEILAKAIIKTAHELVRDGARFLVGGCGYLIKYQRDVSSAVDVPVAMSSLLQIPWILQLLSAERDLLVVTAVTDQVTPSFLEAAGISTGGRVSITSISQDSELHRRTLNSNHVFDVESMECAVVDTVKTAIVQNRSIGAILLECSEFPPYRSAVRAVVDMPVFDFLTLVDFLVSATPGCTDRSTPRSSA